MFTVLIVDDHAAIRQILQEIIEKSDGIQVLGTASSGREAITQVNSYCPDVIVMDISMPQMDGMEATRQVLVQCPTTRVLILSSYDRPDFIRYALEVGAKGYVLKDSIASDLLEGIRTIHQGKYYFSPQIAEIAGNYLPRDGS